MRDEKCMPLWREARFQVKMHTTHQRRTTASCCGGKHISKSKCTKNLSVGPLLEVDMSKKCKAHFPVKAQKTEGTEHFWTFRCRFACQAQGIVHLVKSEQSWKVL